MSSDSLNLAQNLAYTALQKPPSAVTPNVSHPATVSQAPHSPTQPQKKQTPFPILPILAGAVAVVSGALFFLYQRGKHVESLERKAKPLVEKLDQVVEDVKEDVLPKKDGGSKSKHRSSTTQHNTTQHNHNHSHNHSLNHSHNHNHSQNLRKSVVLIGEF